MSSVNKVILIGNLGQDPEIRNFDNGGKVANLRLATSESWKDKATGERKESTEWHSVAVFGPLADTIAQFCRKGSKVYLQGKLQTRKYEKDGQERYATEVVLQGPNAEFRMLDGRNEGGNSPAGQSGGGQNTGNQGGSSGGSSMYDESEDIPF